VDAFAGWDGVERIGADDEDAFAAAVARNNPWRGLPGLELDLSHMGLRFALPSNLFAHRAAPGRGHLNGQGAGSSSSSPLADTLVVLNLTANALTGPVPPSLSGLVRLRAVQLGHNALAGCLPRGWLRPLRELTALNLSHNQLTGRAPQLWPHCAKLEVLDLSCNGFTGRMPATLSRLPQLRGVDLSHNEFDGPLPKVRALASALLPFDYF
jgi:hypothetical protein